MKPEVSVYGILNYYSQDCWGPVRLLVSEPAPSIVHLAQGIVIDENEHCRK